MFALIAHHPQPKQNENLRLERILDPEGPCVEGPLS
jgi:hypothetical protein